MISWQEIIKFWFEELSPSEWWEKSPELDGLIKSRFEQTHNQVVNAESDYWRTTALGRLAEIIVLDQFSRNIYRDTYKAFTYDAQALVLAQEAIRLGADQKIENQKRAFMYLPFMHSESLYIHRQALDLFNSPGHESNLEFEKKHFVIIERFGRYPHRNEILSRESTPEEIEFLKTPNSSF